MLPEWSCDRSVSYKTEEGDKADRAREILSTRLALSVQVLQEFYVQATEDLNDGQDYAGVQVVNPFE